MDEVVAAKDQRRLPVVLTPSEVRVLLLEMSGITGLVASLLDGTGVRLARTKALHDRDLAEGMGRAWLPEALAMKFPRAPIAWGWQWTKTSSPPPSNPAR